MSFANLISGGLQLSCQQLTTFPLQLLGTASDCQPQWDAPVQVVTPAPEDLGYSSLNLTRGPVRPAPIGGRAPQAGARQYQPAGQRFALQRNVVSWLGWTFQASRMRTIDKTQKTSLLHMYGRGDSCRALVQPHSMEQCMCAAQPLLWPRLTTHEKVGN